MGNIIQDIIGLVARAKPVTPRDKDVIPLGRFKDGLRGDGVSGPDMIAEQTTMKKVSDYIVAKVPNELPNPGTEGQVLALDSNLDPIWKDDADTTTTIFQNSDISNDVGATSSAKGDKYIPTIGGIVSAAKPHYVSAAIFGTDITPVSDITSAANMTGMIGMSITNTKSDGILLKGLIRISSITGTVGQTVYFINDNLSTTAPSTSGQYVRIAGYIVDNPISGTLIYFNPSPDFILLS